MSLHYTESGLNYVHISGHTEENHPDYGPLISIPHINELHKSIAEHIVYDRRCMRGYEFRYLRQHLDMSIDQLSRVLGVDEKDAKIYETKENLGKNIQRSTDKLMRILIIEHVLKHELNIMNFLASMKLVLVGDHEEVDFFFDGEKWNKGSRNNILSIVR